MKEYNINTMYISRFKNIFYKNKLKEIFMSGIVSLNGFDLTCEIDEINNQVIIEDKDSNVFHFGNLESTKIDEYIYVNNEGIKYIFRIPTRNFSTFKLTKATYTYDFYYELKSTFDEKKVNELRFYGQEIEKFLFVKPNTTLNKQIKKCGTGLRINLVSFNNDNYVSIIFNTSRNIEDVVHEVLSFNNFMSFLNYKFNINFDLIQLIDRNGVFGNLKLRKNDSFECKQEPINYNYFNSFNLLNLYSNFKKLENIFEFYPRCDKCDDIWTRDRVVGISSSLESVLNMYYKGKVPQRVTDNNDAYNIIKKMIKELKNNSTISDKQFEMFSGNLGFWKNASFNEKINFAIQDILITSSNLITNTYVPDYEKFKIASRITTFRNSVAHGVDKQWFLAKNKKFSHIDYMFAIYIIYYLIFVQIGFTDYSLIDQIIFKLVGEHHAEVILPF